MAATSAKNITKINDERTMQAEKLAYLIANEYDELTLMLEPLPDLIQLLIERYGLDMIHQTEAQKNDLKDSQKILYSTLSLVRDTIIKYSNMASIVDYKQIAKTAEL